jgi:hypothetical protein
MYVAAMQTKLVRCKISDSDANLMRASMKNGAIDVFCSLAILIMEKYLIFFNRNIILGFQVDWKGTAKEKISFPKSFAILFIYHFVIFFQKKTSFLTTDTKSTLLNELVFFSQ